MIRINLISIVLLSLLLFYTGCSESTNPSEGNKNETMQAMEEMNLIIDGLVESDGYISMTEIPDVSQGGASSPIPYIKPSFKNIFAGPDSAGSQEDLTNLFFLFFLPKGTYVYENMEWSYSGLPDDELIFTFPYTDPNTGITHTASWRYYDIIDTETSFTTSFDVYVAGYQFVGLTFQLTGSVNVVNEIIEPVINTFSVTGFVKDDDGTRFDVSVTMNETDMTLTIEKEGGLPITYDLSGDFLLQQGNDLAASMKNELRSVRDLTFYQMAATFGDVVISTEVGEGEIGYINFEGTKVAAIFNIDNILIVRWNDGTEGPLNSYIYYWPPQDGELY